MVNALPAITDETYNVEFLGLAEGFLDYLYKCNDAESRLLVYPFADHALIYKTSLLKLTNFLRYRSPINDDYKKSLENIRECLWMMTNPANPYMIRKMWDIHSYLQDYCASHHLLDRYFELETTKRISGGLGLKDMIKAMTKRV